MPEKVDKTDKKLTKEDLKRKAVPVKLADKIKKKHDRAQQLMQDFTNNALKRALCVKTERELFNELQSNKRSLNKAIKFAALKLNLKDDKEFEWSFYPATNEFIGVPIKKKVE